MNSRRVGTCNLAFGYSKGGSHTLPSLVHLQEANGGPFLGTYQNIMRCPWVSGLPSDGGPQLWFRLCIDQAHSRCSLKMPAPLCCIFILSDPLLPCLPGTSNSSTPQELVRYANFLALLHQLNLKLCGWDLAICFKKPNPLPPK